MMITDKRIEKLQLLSNELCRKYEIFPLTVKRMTTFVGNLAQFNEFDWAIEFDPIFDFKESEFEEIIWHEFRHAWQLLNYEDIYRWWLFPSQERNVNYFKFYREPINSIEEDARIFSITRGKKSGIALLKKFTPEILTVLEEKNLLEKFNEKLICEFGKILDKDQKDV